jgi:hypothetical protein
MFFILDNFLFEKIVKISLFGNFFRVESKKTYNSNLLTLNFLLSTITSQLFLLPALEGFCPPITGEPKGVQRPLKVRGRVF